jgi:hypothetical protein
MFDKSLVSSNFNCNADNYEWLLSRLMIPNNKIIHRGVDVFIP